MLEANEDNKENSIDRNNKPRGSRLPASTRN